MKRGPMAHCDISYNPKHGRCLSKPHIDRIRDIGPRVKWKIVIPAIAVLSNYCELGMRLSFADPSLLDLGNVYPTKLA
jgi:hypothetical protein